MDGREDVILVGLTREEIHEVFSRCLRSQEEDNQVSAGILRKLAQILGTIPAIEKAGRH